MPKIKALFLAANPRSTSRLAIDEEMHAIEQKLRAAEHRDALVFQSALAVRPDDLLQLLNQHQPHIVHFGVPVAVGQKTTFRQKIVLSAANWLCFSP